MSHDYEPTCQKCDILLAQCNRASGICTMCKDIKPVFTDPPHGIPPVKKSVVKTYDPHCIQVTINGVPLVGDINIDNIPEIKPMKAPFTNKITCGGFASRRDILEVKTHEDYGNEVFLRLSEPHGNRAEAFLTKEAAEELRTALNAFLGTPAPTAKKTVREMFQDLYAAINSTIPNSRHRALAITALEDAFTRATLAESGHVSPITVGDK